MARIVIEVAKIDIRVKRRVFRISAVDFTRVSFRALYATAISANPKRGGGWLPPQPRRFSIRDKRSNELACSQGGGMPITSSSVPYLLSSSLNSIRGSRRPSVSSTSSQQGIGLLQQVGSSMVRQLPPICLNLNGPPPPPTLSPSLQLPGQHSH